ncbi:MAG: hypothetical protein ACD_73C00634G0002 [uncultured bacterium]|nr:MAG: hypothetical protein ACD_73C00634G0002 [uncultured bacterium]
MFLFFVLILFIIGCVGLVVYIIKRQNRLIKFYYDHFCQKYNLKVTAMGGTKLYDHPQISGVYQNRYLNIISYVAYRRRASTIIEIGIGNTAKYDFAIFSPKDNCFYLSFKQEDRVKTNDEAFDKQFYIYSKVKPEQGFRVSAYLMNGLKKWPTHLPLKLYINGNALSTVVDQVVVSEKTAKLVEDLVVAMYQLAPALEL